MRLTNIEAERGRAGLTREELSARLGITSATYRRYISGGVIPSDKLVELSNIFRVSLDYLMGLDNNHSCK